MSYYETQATDVFLFGVNSTVEVDISEIDARYKFFDPFQSGSSIFVQTSHYLCRIVNLISFICFEIQCGWMCSAGGWARK